MPLVPEKEAADLVERSIDRALKEILAMIERRADEGKATSHQFLNEVMLGVKNLADDFGAKIAEQYRPMVEAAAKKGASQLPGFQAIDRALVETAIQNVKVDIVDALETAVKSTNAIITDAIIVGRRQEDIARTVRENVMLGEGDVAYKIPKWRAVMVARNELFSTYRQQTLKTAEDLGYTLFKMMGPDDSRTEPICEKYLGQTKTADEWRKIKSNVFEYGLHYQCRHAWVPVRKAGKAAEGSTVSPKSEPIPPPPPDVKVPRESIPYAQGVGLGGEFEETVGRTLQFTSPPAPEKKTPTNTGKKYATKAPEEKLAKVQKQIDLATKKIQKFTEKYTAGGMTQDEFSKGIAELLAKREKLEKLLAKKQAVVAKVQTKAEKELAKLSPQIGQAKAIITESESLTLDISKYQALKAAEPGNLALGITIDAAVKSIEKKLVENGAKLAAFDQKVVTAAIGEINASKAATQAILKDEWDAAHLSFQNTKTTWEKAKQTADDFAADLAAQNPTTLPPVGYYDALNMQVKATEWEVAMHEAQLASVAAEMKLAEVADVQALKYLEKKKATVVAKVEKAKKDLAFIEKSAANALQEAEAWKVKEAAKAIQAQTAAALKSVPPPAAPTPKVKIDASKIKANTIDADTVFGKKVGEATGSNKAGRSGLWVGKDGVKRYVKEYSDPTQVYNEVLSNDIYRRLGFRVPDSSIVQLENGKVAFASVYETGVKGTLGSVGVTKEIAEKISEGIAADILTVNWDVVGTGLDNIVVLASGEVVRIDQGGSLLLRAMGSRKTETHLFNVTEWERFFDPSSHYSQVLKKAGYTRAEDMGKKLISQIDRIEDLYHGVGSDWKSYIMRVVPGIADADADLVARALTKRTQYLQGKKAEILAFMKRTEKERLEKAAQLAGAQNLLAKLDKIASAPMPSIADLEAVKRDLESSTRINWSGSLRKSGPGYYKAGSDTVEESYALYLMGPLSSAIKNFTAKAKKYFVSYTGGGYTDINSALREQRKHGGNLAPRHLEWANSMDKEYAKKEAVTKTRFTITRGGKSGSERKVYDNLKVGEVYDNPQYVSASASPTFARQWAGHGGVIIEYDVTPGTRAIYVEGISSNSSEMELVFARGTRGVITENYVGNDGYRYVKIRTIPAGV